VDEISNILTADIEWVPVAEISFYFYGHSNHVVRQRTYNFLLTFNMIVCRTFLEIGI